jgi:hypothetical protein
VRLAQTLVKAAVILAIIAATLGGAVALGSTLFESPPRDAAEFAARIEAGSTHAPPAETRTAAERRYVLEVSELCAEQNERIRDLERVVSSADKVGRLRGWRRIHADYAEDFLALAPPKRFDQVAARASSLDEGMLELADGALEARRTGDREGFEAKLKAGELLRARYNQTMRDLDAPVCTAA